ncbi:Pro-kumamolisin, activation domain family protein [Rhodococcus sp. G-MC3]|uniref:Pro-kumamolisin, activation domain family protein n=1 Tax=Rhodococcus sp. G-MC3 TaxID=3046209 RepID=UPI0024BBD957|nr:Pro-kumamolisin, activation domain family protein [Rhodococcus sp. G-MC3]MDJ0395298.1 Pro-kumamolisin, activation domain family protein [Rhodococcus sp. G-MC3]
MRPFARATVLASTATIAAAVGAFALAPIASAEEPVPPPALGSAAMPEAPDLVITVGAQCARFDDKAEADTAALEIVVKNVGKGAASMVATNFVVLPAAPGVFNEDKIDAGETVTYTVPSKDAEWVSRPAGAAVFSPQLDANYPDNVAFGLLNVDCVLAGTPAAE